MIARRHRFHGHNSLNYVYRSGSTVRSEFLTLKFANSKKDDYRLAVVVSKKVSKSAVKRNRIRRRIYEIVRKNHKNDAKSWPYDFVLSVFDERIGTIPAPELEECITKIFQKAVSRSR